RRQRVVGEDPLLDRPALDKVLSHKEGDALRRHAGVPCSLWVNQHRWTVTADAQATDLGAVTGVGAAAQAVVLDLLLEDLPRLQTGLRRATVRPRTQKDMASISADTKLRRHRPQFLAILGH